MPAYEHLAVNVKLVIEVDGHVLTFEETGKALGARYGGADPRESGYSSDETLEKRIRGTVDTCVARASRRAELLLARAYPVHSDKPTPEETT